MDVNLYLEELSLYQIKSETNLVRLCKRYSDDPLRLINALYALKEAHDQNRLKNPIGYIYRAIEWGWEPLTIGYQLEVMSL